MAKKEHSSISEPTGTIPSTPPPPTWGELEDIRDAHRNDPTFKTMSNRELMSWAKGRHRNVEEVLGGNRWQGKTVVTRTNSPQWDRLYHYDRNGEYRGTEDKGVGEA